MSMISTTGISKVININLVSEFDTNGEIDRSQCKNLKTPCVATLFMFPRLTRLQLLKNGKCINISRMRKFST